MRRHRLCPIFGVALGFGSPFRALPPAPEGKQVRYQASLLVSDQAKFAGCGTTATQTPSLKLSSLEEFWVRRLRTNIALAECPSADTPLTAGVSLDLSAESSLRAVPSTLFQNCPDLEELVLPPSVTYIQPGAFNGCSRLKQLDMKSLTNLTTLPDDFLSGCSSLEEVCLPQSITRLGANFACGSSLRRLDLSTLTNLTTLPSNFLSRCSQLDELILPPSITAIEEGFLADCTAMKRLDLRSLLRLTELPERFLGGCTQLGEVCLTLNICVIKSGFLWGCPSVVRLDIRALSGLAEIQSEFMMGCTGVEEVLLPPSVTTIGANCFQFCSSLKRLDVSALTEIGCAFMMGCLIFGRRFRCISTALKVVRVVLWTRSVPSHHRTEGSMSPSGRLQKQPRRPSNRGKVECAPHCSRIRLHSR